MRSLIRGARKGLVPFVVAVVMLALAVPALGGPLASGQDRHRRPPAEVKISRDVRLGQASGIRVKLWARCRAPFVVEELAIDVSQAGLSGSFANDFGIVCNGTWHPITTGVTTPEGGPFAPGLTTVNATLTVIYAVTGDPAPQGQDSVTVLVHGQAEVKISRNVRLGQGGAVLVRVFVRCEIPWVVQSFFVGVSQDEGFIFGSTSGDFGIVCDDHWHQVDVQVFSSGEPFGGGLTTVDAELLLLDPIDFDPVGAGTGKDSVTVVLGAPNPRAACGVKNTTQNTWFASDTGSALTSAITAANPGDQLNVFGTCVGTYVIDKDLHISGSHSKLTPTTLDAAGQGRVLYVPVGPTFAPTVTLDHLIITGGNNTTTGGGGGLLVSEGATLTLTKSIVTGNTTTLVGGGITNGGTLTLNTTLVSRNHADIDGGGIYNYGDLVVNGSWVNSNTAVGGGGGIFNEGVAVLSSSRVRFNTASSAGGILTVNLLTLIDSIITNNQPDDCPDC